MTLVFNQKLAPKIPAISFVTVLGAECGFYRRLRSRLGAPKAITATAHKLARLFYQIWATTGQYLDPDIDYYQQKYQEQVLKSLRNKANALGLELVPISPSTLNTSSSLNHAT
ncbi:hypothetical protein [Nostoc sp. UIC 10630]|uniref:hypothetical protein n=1 Tax=Nostoc sp. UIC 10630 TaxID=2100146 RepID=UPI0013D0A8AF|nr:hypothetical protein [Nostoc sp. UIC 10630]NEU81668.1 hypothetical protein [Nostoc sp. UIC 10630]